MGVGDYFPILKLINHLVVDGSEGGCARGARKGEKGGSGGPGRVCGDGDVPGSA